MNKILRKLPLKVKLMLIGLIPFLFLVYLTIQVYNEKTEKLELFDHYKTYIAESANINGLIDAMQEERKFSFDYAIKKNMREQLVLQRPRTDALIEKLIKSNDPALAGFQDYTKLGQLQDIRNKIDSAKIGPNEVMHFYSNTVFRLNTLNTLPPANTPYLHDVYKDLMAQKILSEMITYLSLIRSNIYNVLNTKQYMVETLIGTIGAHDMYQSYEQELLAKASPETKEQFEAVKNTTALKPTMDYITALFTRFSFDDSFTAAEWWRVSDEGTDHLRAFQSTISERLNKKISLLYKKEEQSRTYTLIFLICALACVILSVSYIAWIITRSLKKLRQAAEKICNGETGISIKAESKDAIGSLARSLMKLDRSNKELAAAADAIGKGNFEVWVEPRSDKDILAGSVISMKAELKQYNNKMEHLVQDRTEELARSNEDLRQFAHVASHDLKEPLRKIALFSNMLRDEEKTILSDKGKMYLYKIGHAAQRMSNMIEGVLAYSTVAINEPPVEMVDLNKIMEGVLNDLELVILTKEARIHYKNLPHIKGIELQLHQLFYNLINNALKFAKANVPPEITISSETIEKTVGDKKQASQFVHISFSDNGIGFNPVYAERMFGVFFRLNSKDAYEGTGLGLALCRKIVQRNGGEIYAEGRDGEGATFHILLPA